jgi:N-acetylmuramic acid 6-phosphate etherase
MAFNKITEADSHHNDLEQKSIAELLQGMHQEDQKAVQAVGKVLPQVEQLIAKVVEQLQNGGRLFYIGAGTSGDSAYWMPQNVPPHLVHQPKK